MLNEIHPICVEDQMNIRKRRDTSGYLPYFVANRLDDDDDDDDDKSMKIMTRVRLKGNNHWQGRQKVVRSIWCRSIRRLCPVLSLIAALAVFTYRLVFLRGIQLVVVVAEMKSREISMSSVTTEKANQTSQQPPPEYHIPATSFQLPSIEERVRYYMGEYWYGEDDLDYYGEFNLSEPLNQTTYYWHNGKAKTNTAASASATNIVDTELLSWIPYFSIQDLATMQIWKQQFHHNIDPNFVQNGLFDTPFLFDTSILEEIVSSSPAISNQAGGLGFWMLANDTLSVARTMDGRMRRIRTGLIEEASAMIMVFGAETRTFESLRVPIVSGTRLVDATIPGILAPFDIQRFIEEVQTYEDVLSTGFLPTWENKKAALIWRDEEVGNRASIVEKYSDCTCSDFRSSEERLNTTSSEIVQKDAEDRDHEQLALPVSNCTCDYDIQFRKSEEDRSLDQVLAYRYLLSLEGNTADPMLKFLLFAKDSVVFMPKPMYSTWLMEDKLVPWFHYIPLNSDTSDLQEKINWAKEHFHICRLIARQSTQYIENLLLSDQAKADNEVVVKKIAERYHAKYGHIIARNTNAGLRPLHVPEKAINAKTYEFKFPTVDERVKYYMGRWYDDTQNPPNISLTLLAKTPYFSLNNLAQVELWKDEFHLEHGFHNYSGFVPLVDVPLMYNYSSLEQFLKLDDDQQQKMGSFSFYAKDAFERVLKLGPDGMKMIMVFGDVPLDIDLPAMVKSRIVNGLQGNILGPFNMKRHFATTIQSVDESSPKLKWNEKRSTVIWRGATSGTRRFDVVKKFSTYSKRDIDVGFVELVGVNESDPEILRMKARDLSVSEMLSYRYLLSLEGNDVATGLKWMLYAPDSVVFMQTPTHVSWAMEDKLIPFVHYIPLKDEDASDLPQMLAWARDHDDLCRAISRQATKYMQDLFASKEAQRNNDLVVQKMATIYHRNYKYLLDDYANMVIHTKKESVMGKWLNEKIRRANPLEKLTKPSGNFDSNLIWLLSFPSSDPSINAIPSSDTSILGAIENSTGFATATNYATNTHHFRGGARPVFSKLKSGPFFATRHGSGKQRELPDLIVTLSSCSIGRNKCRSEPSHEELLDFANSCASSSWSSHRAKSKALYSPSMVQKAIHLIQHPINNLVTAYKKKQEQGSKILFSEYCAARNTDPSFSCWQEQAANVPCFPDIVQYVTWHNKAFALSHLVRLPTLVVYVEDFFANHTTTRNQILEWIEQPLLHPKLDSHLVSQNYIEMLTLAERKAIRAFIQSIASEESWLYLKEYDFGL